MTTQPEAVTGAVTSDTIPTTPPRKVKKQQTLTQVKGTQNLWKAEPSGVYYGIIRQNGKQHKDSLETTDFAKAKRKLNDWRIQLSNLAPSAERKTLFKVIACGWLKWQESKDLKISTIQKSKIGSNNLCKYFGKMQLDEITPDIIIDWRVKRLKDVKPNTFNYENNVLKQILQIAVDKGYIIKSPASKSLAIKKSKCQKRDYYCPTEKEFLKLIETIRPLVKGDDSANLVELLGYTGARLNEGTSITWGDIDYEKNEFTITGGEKGTKNHQPRTIPLFKNFRELLERIKASLPTEPNKTDRIIKYRSCGGAIKRACEIAGLPRMNHHGFRHYFITQTFQKTGEFMVLARWVGHNDNGLQISQTYAHLSPEHEKSVASKLM